MSILYCVIASQRKVLGDFSNLTGGNISNISCFLLSKIPDTVSNITYMHDIVSFHILKDNGVIFMCTTNRTMNKNMSFGFLENLKRLWLDRFGSSVNPDASFDQLFLQNINEIMVI
jgi:hypothetical protein